MGAKRRGLAKVQAKLQSLKRELQFKQSTLVGYKKKLKTLTAGTGHVLTAADSGSTVMFTAAGATTVTLPTPELGLHYTFVTNIQATGNHIIKCKLDTQGFVGGLTLSAQTVNKDQAFLAGGGTNDIITMDGDTKGGAPGSRIECIAVSATQWAVTGVVLSDGTEVATPFSDGS
tara:strand:- start:352 stop:873 length:522 start_codon:yes stop_codon:yes gene_type:complete